MVAIYGGLRRGRQAEPRPRRLRARTPMPRRTAETHPSVIRTTPGITAAATPHAAANAALQPGPPRQSSGRTLVPEIGATTPARRFAHAAAASNERRHILRQDDRVAGLPAAGDGRAPRRSAGVVGASLERQDLAAIGTASGARRPPPSRENPGVKRAPLSPPARRSRSGSRRMLELAAMIPQRQQK